MEQNVQRNFNQNRAGGCTWQTWKSVEGRGWGAASHSDVTEAHHINTHMLGAQYVHEISCSKASWWLVCMKSGPQSLLIFVTRFSSSQNYLCFLQLTMARINTSHYPSGFFLKILSRSLIVAFLLSMVPLCRLTPCNDMRHQPRVSAEYRERDKCHKLGGRYGFNIIAARKFKIMYGFHYICVIILWGLLSGFISR